MAKRQSEAAGEELKNLDAEKSVLGSILLDQRCLKDVRKVLDASAFWRPGHRAMYTGMLALEAAGKAVELLTLKEYLIRYDKLEECGGTRYMVEVAEFVPSPANAVHYAQIVADLAFRRSLSTECISLSHKAKNVSDVGALQSEAKKMLLRVNKGSAVSLSGFESLPYDEDEHPFNYVFKTGIDRLDATIGVGGLYSGQITTVTAQTGQGKTTFMVQLFLKAARDIRFFPGYVLLGDLTKGMLRSKCIRQRTGFLRRPNDLEGSAEFDQALKEISQPGTANVFAMEDYGRDLSAITRWMYSHCEEADRKNNIPVLFIDKFTDIRIDGWRSQRYEMFEEIAVALNCVAKETGAIVVVASQISGEKETTAGSSALDRETAIRLHIARVKGETKIRLAKDRFGPDAGKEFDVEFDRVREVYRGI